MQAPESAGPARVKPLHGGAARVVVLTVRSLGYRHGMASLFEGGELRPITATGDDDVALLAAARAAVAAPEVDPSVAPTYDDALAVPVRDATGVAVGALCVSGAPEGRDVALDLSVLASFAEVLQDQLDLLRLLGPPPDAGAVVRLREAIELGQVRAWFQPIVRLEDESLVGFEALARWHAESGEVARPGDFVPLAERAGLVDRLDMAVLRSAVEQLARWHRTHPHLRLSVNISGRHLDDPTWVDDVHEAVTTAGVSPRTVELELTESVRPSDVVRSAGELQRARDLGYEVWFDDFGTGWSELRQLVELPVDGVKVDRFFTEALGGRGDSVVRAMVQIAGDLGLATVIEGVSTREHAVRAAELGCELAQGFLWSQAVPAGVVDEVLASPSGRFRAADR